MQTKKRFIQSVIETAANLETPLPWARGERRKVFIYNRRAVQAGRETA